MNGPQTRRLTEMTRMARRPLPRLVHSSRSRAEFRDAPRRRGAASQDAARSRRSSGSSPAPAPGGEPKTPSRKLRSTPGSVSSSTTTGRAPEVASPLVGPSMSAGAVEYGGVNGGSDKLGDAIKSMILKEEGVGDTWQPEWRVGSAACVSFGTCELPIYITH
jgi:hypothetical protein